MHGIVRHIVIAMVALAIQPAAPILQVVAIRAIEINDARPRLTRNGLKAPDRIVDCLAQVPCRMHRVLGINGYLFKASIALGLRYLRAPISANHCAGKGAVEFLLNQEVGNCLAEYCLIFFALLLNSV